MTVQLVLNVAVYVWLSIAILSVKPEIWSPDDRKQLVSLKSIQCFSFDPQHPLKSYAEDAGTSASARTATKNADDDHDLPTAPDMRLDEQNAR